MSELSQVAETQAFLRLARQLADVLQGFADSAGNAGNADDEPVPPVAEQSPRPADEHALGKRQRQIVEVPGLASEEGMKTAEVAAAVDYELPNTYTALQALARSQVVEQVPGSQPQRWRLVRRYRGGSQVFAHLANLVGAGEWTTAGDIAIAARGDLRAVDGIVRAGLSHRVLANAAPSEQQLRGRLATEGVMFIDGGRADPRQRVSWEELARRAAARESRRRTVTRATLNYVQIPVVDLQKSITFYEQVFGWRVTRRPTAGGVLEQTGYAEFTDSAGQAGGGFVLGRPPTREPGVMPCIAVDSIEDTLAATVAYGGEVVQPRTAIVDGTDWEAIFRDPAGNALGLYEASAG